MTPDHKRVMGEALLDEEHRGEPVGYVPSEPRVMRRDVTRRRPAGRQPTRGWAEGLRTPRAPSDDPWPWKPTARPPWTVRQERRAANRRARATRQAARR